MRRLLETKERLLARTRPQLMTLAVLVVICLGGMLASLVGHPDLGRTLVGLVVISLVPYSRWLKATDRKRQSAI